MMRLFLPAMMAALLSLFGETLAGTSVRTIEELRQGVEADPAGSYSLASDISLPASFVPLPSFSGSLEGNGHVIRASSFTAIEGNAGLFLALDGAMISGLSIELSNSLSLYRSGSVGGLAAEAHNVSLSGVSVSGSWILKAQPSQASSSSNLSLAAGCVFGTADGVSGATASCSLSVQAKNTTVTAGVVVGRADTPSWAAAGSPQGSAVLGMGNYILRRGSSGETDQNGVENTPGGGSSSGAANPAGTKPLPLTGIQCENCILSCNAPSCVCGLIAGNSKADIVQSSVSGTMSVFGSDICTSGSLVGETSGNVIGCSAEMGGIEAFYTEPAVLGGLVGAFRGQRLEYSYARITSLSLLSTSGCVLGLAVGMAAPSSIWDSYAEVESIDATLVEALVYGGMVGSVDGSYEPSSSETLSSQSAGSPAMFRVANSYASAGTLSVTMTSKSSTDSGHVLLGGFVGELIASTALLTQCYSASATLTASGATSAIFGGFLGFGSVSSQTESIQVLSCWADSGHISVERGTVGRFGGFVGAVDVSGDGLVEISDCYALGTAKKLEGSDASLTGAFVGGVFGTQEGPLIGTSFADFSFPSGFKIGFVGRIELSAALQTCFLIGNQGIKGSEEIVRRVRSLSLAASAEQGITYVPAGLASSDASYPGLDFEGAWDFPPGWRPVIRGMINRQPGSSTGLIVSQTTEATKLPGWDFEHVWVVSDESGAVSSSPKLSEPQGCEAFSSSDGVCLACTAEKCSACSGQASVSADGKTCRLCGDDEYFNTEYARCVLLGSDGSTCLQGPTAVPGCVACVGETGSASKLCARCSGVLVPSGDGLSCVQCGSGLKPNVDNSGCVSPEAPIENCTSGSTAVKGCTQCSPGDKAKCVACSGALVPSADGKSCVVCGDGLEPDSGNTKCQPKEEGGGEGGGDPDPKPDPEPDPKPDPEPDPNACLLARSGVQGCTSCSKTDPSRCAACSGNLVPSPTGDSCVSCGQGTVPNANNTACVVQDNLCLVGAGAVPGCTSCQKTDPTSCAACSGSLVPSPQGTACVPCSSGMMANSENTACVSAEGTCLGTDSLVEHCASCNPEDKKLCSSCAAGYSLVPGANRCVPGTSCEVLGAHCSGCDNAVDGVEKVPTRCTTCAGGYSLDESGVCQKAKSNALYIGLGVAAGVIILVAIAVGIGLYAHRKRKAGGATMREHDSAKAATVTGSPGAISALQKRGAGTSSQETATGSSYSPKHGGSSRHGKRSKKPQRSKMY